MNGRFWFLIGVLLSYACVRLLGQGDATIQDILENGTQSIQVGNLRYRADFAADEGWNSVYDQSHFFRVEQGSYLIEHDRREHPVRSIYRTESYADTIIVAKATQLSEDNNNGFGVICRADYQFNFTGYYFFISGDGFAQIFTYRQYIRTGLTDRIAVPIFNVGQNTNEIMAVCSNRYLALYVNGNLVAEAEDDTYSAGHVGLASTTYSIGTTINIAFNNFHVFSSYGGEGNFVPVLVNEIHHYEDDWQEIIGELEMMGAIPSGGELIFSDRSISGLSNAGSVFEPLHYRSSTIDLVFGGFLYITSMPETGVRCGFTSRYVVNNNYYAQSYFEISADLQEDMIVGYSVDETNEIITYETLPHDLQIGVPIHILYVLRGDRATIYIDGQLWISDMLIADFPGVHVFVLRGIETGGRCEGRDMFAYSIIDANAGLCEVITDSTVSQYRRASTAIEPINSLELNERVRVIAQTIGLDGSLWWQLENKNWVREDVVRVQGDCSNIAEVD